ncbi:berberine bridge enzyme-like 21 [Carica papaya]|uniref:berberine bridge enzyme-like 21 n=1 Tax=Carica papaya TaxID=3649 RepID=UPI000B8CDDE7|nr:berberine bridge enzyme-like 21 [Carica papaya]
MAKPSSMSILAVCFLLFFTRFELSSAVEVYQTFLQCMTNQTGPEISKAIFAKTNSAYTSVLQAYLRNARLNTSTAPKPEIIITPLQESHVQAAVICSKKVGFRLKIRSGGHDYDGISYVSDLPFFMLDMYNLRSVTVDMADLSAWVGSGATLGEVYHAIWKKSKVLGFPAGVCPTVGAGGHISGGGYGNMIRKYGLSVDHMVDAKIVDVNGRILYRKSMGEDLFWAIRGGGGASFCVILSYKLKLVPVPETVTVFRVQYYMEENALDITHKWQFVGPKTNPGLFMRVLLQPITWKKNRTIRTTIMALFLGKADEVVSLLGKEFPEMGLKKENCTEMTWIQSVLWWSNIDDVNSVTPDVLLDRHPGSGSFMKRKSDYVSKEISKPDLESLFKQMIKIGKTGLVFNPYGGALKEVSATETPFPHRDKLYKIQYSVNWVDAGIEADKQFMNEIRTLYGYMTPLVSQNPRGSYINYRDLDIGINKLGGNVYEEGKVYGKMYFGDNFDRLVKVKTAVDPGNFFWNEQSIPPLKTAA